MAPRLLPCPDCSRHVRIIESFCPFCGGTLPLAYQQAGPARVPNQRLGRGALMAFGAAALAAGGCSGDDSTTTDTGTGDSSIGVDSSAGDSAAGDSSVTDSAVTDSMRDATMDSAVVAAYGGPILVDSGADADDAMMDDGAVMNLYGAPPEP